MRPEAFARSEFPGAGKGGAGNGPRAAVLIHKGVSTVLVSETGIGLVFAQCIASE